ncbi:hypothetical protein Patl1_00459 [Pistacia atlantica]|uniref:Uncharacterized protein n=1 Tax=Pistacia atlantica TaxID=434234 RepID=A0ACC1CDC1_9ROSI|nr:hypothetical protein Patl1_00459 [Pistacia atlantica]
MSSVNREQHEVVQSGEVEDFARRLNSDWPERMQEILSLGQEIRPQHYSVNGNGRRNAIISLHGENQIGSRNDITPDWPHGWNNFDQMLMQVV